jgi:hypothetical protein
MTRPAEIGTEGSSTLPLRIDRITSDPRNAGRTLYCTSVDDTELRVGVPDCPGTDLTLTPDRWYRFDGVVRSGSPDAELLFPSQEGGVERIDAPERRTRRSSDTEDPWLIQLGEADDTVAMAVQPRPTDGMEGIRPGDPGSFEIGAVCLAPCDGTDDRVVYHRENPDTHDEHLLLEHVVSDLSENAGMTLVTHGTRSPIRMLQARIDGAAGGGVVNAEAGEVLEKHFHADLRRATDRAGVDSLGAIAHDPDTEAGPVRFSDYDLGVDPADLRNDGPDITDVSDPRMTDRDYATLLEWHLDPDDETVEPGELARCLKAHASRDLPVLRAVATSDVVSQVGCSRLAGRLPD